MRIERSSVVDPLAKDSLLTLTLPGDLPIQIIPTLVTCAHPSPSISSLGNLATSDRCMPRLNVIVEKETTRSHLVESSVNRSTAGGSSHIFLLCVRQFLVDVHEQNHELTVALGVSVLHIAADFLS